MTTASLAPGERERLPFWSFLIHALVALGSLLYLNYLIGNSVPVAVKKIGSSYLIFFYHLPAALNCFLFFTGTAVFSIAFLVTKNARWDTWARVCGEILEG